MINTLQATTGPDRLGALRRFAVAITVLTILGHSVFGFEQSPLQPLVAIVTAYTLEALLEVIDARMHGRRPRFAGGLRNAVDFLLSPHISGLAVAMLLYANDRLLPFAFAAAAAIASKAVFRIRAEQGTIHFLNPSNFGITITLLLFPWVGIAPPYHFTENLGDVGDVLLPTFIVLSGTLLNGRFTKRLALIVAWWVGFAAQAVIRSYLQGTPVTPALLPMTGVAFILFSFYMITDPATTPNDRRGQIAFGLATGALYGMLVTHHVVFGLFFALTVVCVLRGLALAARPRLVGTMARYARKARPRLPGPTPAPRPADGVLTRSIQ